MPVYTYIYMDENDVNDNDAEDYDTFVYFCHICLATAPTVT